MFGYFRLDGRLGQFDHRLDDQLRRLNGAVGFVVWLVHRFVELLDRLCQCNVLLRRRAVEHGT